MDEKVWWNTAAFGCSCPDNARQKGRMAKRERQGGRKTV
jgi:hypothetical protein